MLSAGILVTEGTIVVEKTIALWIVAVPLQVVKKRRKALIGSIGNEKLRGIREQNDRKQIRFFQHVNPIHPDANHRNMPTTKPMAAPTMPPRI